VSFMSKMLSSAGVKVAVNRLRSLLCNVSMAPLFVSASVFAAAAEDVTARRKSELLSASSYSSCAARLGGDRDHDRCASFFMWKRRSPGSHFSSSSQARVLPPSCLYSTSFPLLLFLFIRMWLTRWLLVAQIHSLLPICINEIVQIVPLQRIGPIVHCTTLCSLPCASEVTLQRRSSSVPAYRLEMASACFIRPEAWQSRMCPDEVWLVIWAFVAGTTSGHHIVSLAMSTYIRIYRC